MHIHFTGILKSFEELNTSSRGALATWRGRETRLAIKTLELALPADRNNVCALLVKPKAPYHKAERLKKEKIFY